jgi:uncharacterized protein YybS (DUF2232 family)
LPALHPGTPGKELLFQIVLTVGLFLSIPFLAPIGFFPGILTPAPTAVALIRWAPPNAWLVPGCSALIGSLTLYLLDVADYIPCLLALIGMGAIMGQGLRYRWSTEKVVGFSSLFAIGIAALVIILALAETNGELFDLIAQQMRAAISTALKEFWGTTPETQELESRLADAVPLIVQTIPGMLVSTALVISWLNLLVSRRYCRMASIELGDPENLTLWKTPEFIVWFAIAGGLMTLFPVSDFRIPGINLLVIIGAIYFLHGLAIAAFYFEKWKLPLFVKGFLYALLFLQQFASLATAIMGLFDMWFDFRKLSRKQA